MARDLVVGRRTDQDGDAVLDASRFNRHTFWCGQSGSGKTYALGVVLEQLLLQTRLPIVVLDPNADFVRLGELRDDVDPATAAAWADLDLRILRSGDGPGERLHARFVGMPLRSRAAVLRLDPLRDREEYNVLLHLEDEFGPRDGPQFAAHLRASTDPHHRRLLQRIENLGVLDWELWAWGGESAEDVVRSRPHATVLDLGGFRTLQESRVAALAVLDDLWATREERSPVLIVIDEAHNLCPPDPVTPVEVALTERIVQIAAEGRKYGLWLVLSTQRPSKVHANALSQCDNLCLMKMSSPRDLAELRDLFGYVPDELFPLSPHFTAGQALLAGGFVAEPTQLRVGRRLTHEGGIDVAVPL